MGHPCGKPEHAQAHWRDWFVNEDIKPPVFLGERGERSRDVAHRQQRDLPPLEGGNQRDGESITVSAEIDDIVVLWQHCCQSRYIGQELGSRDGAALVAKND